MNALFLFQREINISLTPQTCAELQAQIDAKKRFMLPGGLLPGCLRLRADKADAGAQKRFFSCLKGYDRFHSRAHWAETTCLHTLSVRMAEQGAWELCGHDATLCLPPEEWRLFCAELEYFLAGHWLFHLELASCGMCLTFASHGSDEADKPELMVD